MSLTSLIVRLLIHEVRCDLTDRQTQVLYVTLAAHARRGLMKCDLSMVKTVCSSLVLGICDPLWEKVRFGRDNTVLLRSKIGKNLTVLTKLLFVTGENYGVASAFSRWSGVDSLLLALEVVGVTTTSIA